MRQYGSDKCHEGHGEAPANGDLEIVSHINRGVYRGCTQRNLTVDIRFALCLAEVFVKKGHPEVESEQGKLGEKDEPIDELRH